MQLTITTIHNLTRADITRIVVDLVIYKKLPIESIKRQDIERLINNHLYYQGITTYDSWHTEQKVHDAMAATKKVVKPYIDVMFKDIDE